MLKKLLKYDLKWCFKPLLVFYLLAIFFSIIVRIVESFEQSLILLIIDKICCGVVIAMIINILINCFMRNWARFVKNIYKDEAYLTHTLPVNKNKIYLSKILTAVITLLTSFIVIIVCLAIATLNEETWIILKESLEQSAIFFNSSVSSFIIVLVITIFFEFLFMMMSGILGIIIGHNYVAGMFNTDIMSVFTNMEVSSNAIKSIMVVGIFIYAIYNFVLYFVGNKILSKGVNID